MFDPSRSVDAGVGPNQSASPKPLATAVAVAPRDAGRDDAGDEDAGDAASDAAVAPPRPLAATERLPADPRPLRDRSGIALDARWLWPNVDTKAIDDDGVAALAANFRRLWKVQLSGSGRMRIDFASRGLPLALGSALVARYERYGALLLWPDDKRYRVLPAGTLRPLLDEGRADMTPLVLSPPEERGEGERLGYTTRKTSVRTSYGELLLEQATVPEAGFGAPLLCRTLVEIIGLMAETPVCQPNTLPLRAEFRWGAGENVPLALVFEAQEVTRRTDLNGRRFAMPPAGATRGLRGLPLPTGSLRMTASELASLRKTEAPPATPGDDGAPTDGASARNDSDQPIWLLIDGLPAAVVPAWGETRLKGLKNGRYRIQWRTFLGEFVSEAGEEDTPALFRHGTARPLAQRRDAG